MLATVDLAAGVFLAVVACAAVALIGPRLRAERIRLELEGA
jgi:hypothetical protein